MQLVSYGGACGRIDGDELVLLEGSLDEILADPYEAKGLSRVPLDKATLGPPVPSPGKIVAVGLNYADHAAETNTPIPSEPVLFAKFANSVVGPEAVVVIPSIAMQPDYEAELGVVIGRRASRVTGNALSYVGGYVCLNDVSARDLQHSSSQWLRGKAIDTFLPMGPWLLTADEMPDPQVLSIGCKVNGELRQGSSTAQMIWGVADLIEFISQTITLEPGDVIATGTPPGVGVAMDPPQFLHDGDVMEVAIDQLGTLRNTVERR